MAQMAVNVLNTVQLIQFSKQHVYQNYSILYNIPVIYLFIDIEIHKSYLKKNG